MKGKNLPVSIGVAAVAETGAGAGVLCFSTASSVRTDECPGIALDVLDGGNFLLRDNFLGQYDFLGECDGHCGGRGSGDGE